MRSSLIVNSRIAYPWPNCEMCHWFTVPRTCQEPQGNCEKQWLSCERKPPLWDCENPVWIVCLMTKSWKLRGLCPCTCDMSSVYMLHDLCIWEITLQCIKRLFVSWHDTQSCSSQPIKSLQSHFLWLQNGWKACLWKNPTETKEQRENACKNVSEQVSEKWRQGYWLAGFKTALFL